MLQRIRLRSPRRSVALRAGAVDVVVFTGAAPGTPLPQRPLLRRSPAHPTSARTSRSSTSMPTADIQSILDGLARRR